MIKLLTTLFFLTAVVNAASNNSETCYTVQLLSSYKSQANSGFSEEEYPKDCKVMTLNKTQTVRCGCYDKYAPAEARLKELKGEYKKALVAMTYKHRFDGKNIAYSLTPDSIVQGTAPKDDLSLDDIQEQNTTIDTSKYTLTNDDLTSGENGLALDAALEILKAQNLEIKAAKIDVEAAKANEGTASGMNWGKLTFQQDVARSNDALSVFGFKLSSREATFGDFGFSEFSNTNPNILNVQPKDLNYPGYRNFFQSKLKYELPLFTGFAISSYEDIMKEMSKMKKLDKDKIENEKIYQLRKSYYDVALLDTSIAHLNIVMNNINILENTTKTMIEVGYAKKVDLLEVQAKKGNVTRLLVQMKANKELLLQYISFLLNKKVTEIRTPKTDVPMPAYTDAQILKTNLDIKRATEGLAIRKSMQGAAEGAFYPTVGAFGEVSTADNTFLGDASDHKAYTIGARLTWNLFNGGTDNSKLEKAKLDRLKMSSQVQLAKEGIALKIAKIRTKIKSINVEIASLEKELALANAIYENYEYRYKEKLVSMSDVIIKQSLQIEKILQLQQAKNKRTEAVFALEKLANGEN
ncbi:TolC family protein [Sulfurimonas sp.]|uniref:TolC family protein n=1 Tax=Sulfurimonas sp. TaxID=2022749 RepID=UPI0026115350|nr:TolC family protein [Sulfurimonas sp.]